jgi:U3 small nucleolar RNA-associated protein 19
LSRVKLDDTWIRKVLVGLHGDKGILGNMKSERRVRLTDWLGTLVDGGGANAMLAMNGLYVLMTQYNL